MKLLCFPYAGATSVAFLKWKKYMKGINIIPIDPPGRGRRIAEPLCKTINEMVDDVKVQVLPLISGEEEYAVYGHSMGSLLVFELLHELLRMGFPLPIHVFLSGKNPPHIPIEKPIHELKDDEFIEKVVAMGGMEARFFENPLLARLFLPILRTDLGILEDYHYEKKKQRLPVDITFFFASDDEGLSRQSVRQWADFASGSFRMYYFTGGHFFIHHQQQGEKIAGIIQETLSNVYDIIPY